MIQSEGFFVIFNLGVGSGSYPEPKQPLEIEYDLVGSGILVRAVYVAETKRLLPSFTPHSNDGRYAFWLTDKRRHEQTAQRVVDALFATITLLYQTDLSQALPFDKGPVAYWLPERMLKHEYFLKRSDLLNYDSGLQFRLGYCSTIPASVVETAWRMLPAVLQEPYFDAVHFYQASVKDFCFMGDSVSAVIYGDITQPVSRSEFVRAENAIINAFKAIEAIIGDPPKDDIKFRRKLQEVGIDYNELAGYVGRGVDGGIDRREPIGQKIRKMSDMRDKKAAHGRTKSNRHITYFDLMDFQSCAEVVVQVAIEQKMGWQNIR